MVPVLLTLVACRSDDPEVEPPVPGDQPDQPEPPQPPDEEPEEPDCVPTNRIVINEVSPANVSVLLDEEGESPDWLELYNADTVPVSLQGWTLSDDGDVPDMWSIPSLTLQPGELLVVYASGEGQNRPVVAWDTRVDQGHTWRYLPVTQAPPAGWFVPQYDDSGWASGPSGFGRSDEDDATVVDVAQTIFVRTEIELTEEELLDLGAMYLHVDYDDAFVAYLNGVEIAREGIGTSGIPPAWDELAKWEHEAELYQGLPLPPHNLRDQMSLLHEGTNTLALEVHQGSPTSQDLTLVPFLTLGFTSERPANVSELFDLSGTQMHTNFSLSADGEKVHLYDPVGCEADELDPGHMSGDQSYGRQPDGADSLGYFMEPTPGALNTTESRPGFVTTPQFNPPPGHYPGGTDVVVYSEGNAEIHYTFEGWDPDETSPVYDVPLATGNSGDGVVIRAVAYKDGLWPSRVATGTFILREPSDLAVISLVTEPDNLWSDEAGIYVLGPPDHDTFVPYFGANFWESWAPPVHVEEWEPDGTQGFSVDAEFRIHGGYTRIFEQKGLLVKLKSGYGDDEIEHEVFPGLGIDKFDRLLLRPGGNDWHGCFSGGCLTGTHLRDSLMHRIASSTDLDVMASRPAEVYLNGEYWGIYEIREKPDLSYVESHHGHENIDLLEQHGRVLEGDGVHYQQMMEFLRTHDLSEPANYAHAQSLMEVDELATYLVFEIFYSNTDWPGNNIKYWRPRTPDGRWRWMMYDTDFGLGLWGSPPDLDTLGMALDPVGAEWPNPPWSTELFRLMVQSPEFSRDFVNRYADYLNTILLPEHTVGLLDEMVAERESTMPRHVERWGSFSDGSTTLTMPTSAWEWELGWVREWLDRRPDYARNHIIKHFGLEGTWTLELDLEPAGAGTLQLNTIEVKEAFAGTYFQGVPVTITALPAPGYTFVGWSDPTLPGDATIEIDASQAVNLVAYFE
jgi:hypothetical protein